MNSGGIEPANSGVRARSACLYGCLALVAIAVIIAAAGGWAIYRAAGSGVSLTGGMTVGEAFHTGEQFVAGLADGSIRPEVGVQIACRLFIDMSDGVLTKEEIGSILEQIRRACGASL
jgi:hypothetical protein